MKRLLLICLILILSLSLISCTSFDSQAMVKIFAPKEDQELKLTLNENQKLSATDLVHALVRAIESEDLERQIFNSLDNSVTEEIDYNLFSDYLAILRKASGLQINLFQRVSTQERQELNKKLIGILPQMQTLIESSSYFKLRFQKLGEEEKQDSGEHFLYLAVQHNAKGGVYLAKDWLTHIYQPYLFSQFYFQGIQDQSVKHLSSLLASTDVVDDNNGSKIYQHKAEKILANYKRWVITKPLDSELVIALPGLIEYSQDAFNYKQKREVRKLSFQENNGKYQVNEGIVDELKEEHLAIYEGQDIAFNALNLLGRNFSQVDFSQSLGRPLAVDYKGGDESFKVMYKDLTLIIKGKGDRLRRSWEGEIEAIELASRRFSLGQELKIGHDLGEVYKIYPFIHESGYVVKGRLKIKDLNLTIYVYESMVKKIRLSLDLSSNN